MEPKQIRDAWARIRTIDQTIPDDVLDFMKDAALHLLKGEPSPASDNPPTEEQLQAELTRMKNNDPDFDLNLEYGKLMLKHIDKLTPEERKRYDELEAYFLKKDRAASDNKGAEKVEWEITGMGTLKAECTAAIWNHEKKHAMFFDSVHSAEFMLSALNSLQAAREQIEVSGKNNVRLVEINRELQQENERLKQGAYTEALKWYKQGALDACPNEMFEDGIEADFYTGYGSQFPDPDTLPSPEQPETEAGVKEEGKQ